MRKYVLCYESADDLLAKAPAHFEAHVVRGHEFHARGVLLMYGPFGDPQRDGGVHQPRVRREFAESDPFVLNAVVRNWFVREWDETFLPV